MELSETPTTTRAYTPITIRSTPTPEPSFFGPHRADYTVSLGLLRPALQSIPNGFDPDTDFASEIPTIINPLQISVRYDARTESVQIYAPNLDEDVMTNLHSYIDFASNPPPEPEGFVRVPNAEDTEGFVGELDPWYPPYERYDERHPPYLSILKSNIADDKANALLQVAILAQKLHLENLYIDAYNHLNDLLSKRLPGWLWYNPALGEYWKGHVRFSEQNDITPMGAIELARRIYGNMPDEDDGTDSEDEDEPVFHAIDDSDIGDNSFPKDPKKIAKTDGRKHVDILMTRLQKQANNELLELILKFYSTRIQYYRYDTSFRRALKSLPSLSYDLLLRYPPQSPPQPIENLQVTTFIRKTYGPSTYWNENRQWNLPDWESPSNPGTLERVFEYNCKRCLSVIEKALKEAHAEKDTFCFCTEPVRNGERCSCNFTYDEKENNGKDGDGNCFACSGMYENNWDSMCLPECDPGMRTYCPAEVKQVQREIRGRYPSIVMPKGDPGPPEVVESDVELEEGGGVWLKPKEWEREREEWVREVREEAEFLKEEKEEMARERVGEEKKRVVVRLMVGKRKREVERRERRRKRVEREGGRWAEGEMERWDVYEEMWNEKDGGDEGNGEDGEDEWDGGNEEDEINGEDVE